MAFVLIGLLLGAVTVCLIEARRYQDYQIEELVATFAYYIPTHKKLAGEQEKLDKDRREFEESKFEFKKEANAREVGKQLAEEKEKLVKAQQDLEASKRQFETQTHEHEVKQKTLEKEKLDFEIAKRKAQLEEPPKKEEPAGKGQTGPKPPKKES